MKRIVFIAVCILGISCFSSCKSTSKHCGLGDNTTTVQTTLQHVDLT
jgi:hypothetical protein